MSEPEFQHFILPNRMNLHVHPTRKFKTVVIKIFLHTPLDGKVTRRALLPFVLRRGSRKFPTMMHISRALEELYGASFSADLLKIGERQILYFRVTTLSPRYALYGEDTIGLALEFLKDVVCNPLTENGGLRQDYVEREKENLKNLILSLIDDKDAFARERLIQEMCRGEPFASYEYGKVEEVDSITPVALHSVHREVLARSPADIFVAGHVRPERIYRKVAEVWDIERDSEFSISDPTIRVPGCEPRYITEDHVVTQARLRMGFRTDIRYSAPEFAALAIANGIFGAYSHSRLFRIAREKEGLCYSVGSSLVKSKGLLLVGAGIDQANYERMVEIVMRELRAIASGDFTAGEFRSTVASIVDDIRSMSDLPSQRVDHYLEQRLNGLSFSIPQLVANVRAATREQVAAAMRRVHLDTVYLMRPAKE